VGSREVASVEDEDARSVWRETYLTVAVMAMGMELALDGLMAASGKWDWHLVCVRRIPDCVSGLNDGRVTKSWSTVLEKSAGGTESTTIFARSRVW